MPELLHCCPENNAWAELSERKHPYPGTAVKTPALRSTSEFLFNTDLLLRNSLILVTVKLIFILKQQ